MCAPKHTSLESLPPAHPFALSLQPGGYLQANIQIFPGVLGLIFQAHPTHHLLNLVIKIQFPLLAHIPALIVHKCPQETLHICRNTQDKFQGSQNPQGLPVRPVGRCAHVLKQTQLIGIHCNELRVFYEVIQLLFCLWVHS